MSVAPITSDGQDFLKLATASPDFADLECQGIPDAYTGRTICKKEFSTNTVVAPAGESTFLVVTPTTAVAFYRHSGVVGVEVKSGAEFDAVLHPDTGTMFPFAVNTDADLYAGSNTTNVSKMRMMSCSAELNCLNNAFNQFGSIACYKTPLTVELISRDAREAGPPVDDTQYTDLRAITGGQAIAAVNLSSNNYIRPVRDGGYSVVMNRDNEFDWYPIWDGESMASTHPSIIAGQPSLTGYNKMYFKGPLVGWDNGYDTIVFRIDVPPTVADQSFIFKVWKSFEYQPIFNSLLYNLSYQSPLEDRTANDLYRAIESELPIAVPSRDNPDFWESILEAVSISSNILSFVPGPIGAVAKGTHAVTAALTQATRASRRPARTRRKGRKNNTRKKTRKKKRNNRRRR